MPWCSKHNREMLKSKYGDNQFWCPDCSREKKEAGGFQKAVQPDRTEEILEAQRKTYAKLLDLEKEIREAIKIFGEK